ATEGMIVSLGSPVLHHNAVLDGVALVCDAHVLGFVAKHYLAGDGIYYEPRWFKPWPDSVRSETVVAGKRYPIGDLYFDCGGMRIGFEICEDTWMAKRPETELSLQGMDVIRNPRGSHFAFGQHEI